MVFVAFSEATCQPSYSASVTWSPHVAGPSVRNRWVMNRSGAAPCQCHSPDGVCTRAEVDGRDIERGLALSLDDAVDPHIADEPVRRSLGGGLSGLYLHHVLRGSDGVVAQLASRSNRSRDGEPGSAL